MSAGACGPGQKLCGDRCVSALAPSSGCGSQSCEPCALPRSAAVCAGDECAVAACELGFGDCNAVAADGCEIDLRGDPSHCGGCGEACSIPRAVAACVSGRCEPASCVAGYAECDADPSTVCETNVTTDSDHCGACGAACALPYADQVECVAGDCVATKCVSGRADCNAGGSTGCETDITRDENNCGGCGLACSPDAVCEGGVCVPRCPAIRAQHNQARISVKPTGFGVGSGDFTLEVWLVLREGIGSPVCGMNEKYSVNGVRLDANSTGVACIVINPSGSGAGSGSAALAGPGLQPGHWTHLACVRKGPILTLYVDGKPTSSGPIGTDLLELSPFVIGFPEWHASGPKELPGLSSLGPIRFSKSARYVAAFAPTTHWPVDGDAVAQFLTKLPYAPATSNPLVDEAGGDNLATDFGGFAPELAEIGCPN